MKSLGSSAGSHERRMRGFTLIELLVTVAIVVIATAIALPSMREFSIRMATKDNTNQLVGALNIARAEAVKRGRPVALIANSGNWNNGWQLVVAKETAGGIEVTPVSPGATEAACRAYLDNAVVTTNTVPLCLQHRGALENNYTILGAGQSNVQLIFEATGGLRDAIAFDFSICRPAAYSDATQSRRIHVAPSGTIEARRDTNSAPAGACP